MSGDRGDTGLRYDIASAKVVRGQKTILGPCGSNKGQPLNVKLFEPKKMMLSQGAPVWWTVNGWVIGKRHEGGGANVVRVERRTATGSISG